MQGQRNITRLVVLGLSIAALGASVAQSATRPDDRAGFHGVGVRPHVISGDDDFSRYLRSHSINPVRPDDRAGPHGATPAAAQAVARTLKHGRVVVRPDDRAGARGAAS
jgi:hypothetical protein